MERLVLRPCTFAAAMCLLFALAGAAHATVYDVAADFDQGWTTNSNPNGVWSYGYSSGFTNPITLYDRTGLAVGDEKYWFSSSVNVGNSPVALYNDGPAFNDGNVDYLANEFVLVAGIGGQYSDLVFTAPAAGTYSIVSSFRGAQFGVGTLVGIVENGTVIFNSSVTSVGQTVPFDTDVSLTAGETVEFSVGPGGGLQNTGLSLTITSGVSVPEPGTLALVATGLTGLMLARRRKRT